MFSRNYLHIKNFPDVRGVCKKFLERESVVERTPTFLVVGIEHYGGAKIVNRLPWAFPTGGASISHLSADTTSNGKKGESCILEVCAINSTEGALTYRN